MEESNAKRSEAMSAMSEGEISNEFIIHQSSFCHS